MTQFNEFLNLLSEAKKESEEKENIFANNEQVQRAERDHEIIQLIRQYKNRKDENGNDLSDERLKEIKRQGKCQEKKRITSAN